MQSPLFSRPILSSVQLSKQKYFKSKVLCPTVFSKYYESKSRDVYVKNNFNEHVIIAANALAYISILVYSYKVHNDHLKDIKILEKTIRRKKLLRDSKNRE